MKFKLNNNLEYLIPILIVVIFYILNTTDNGMFGLFVIPTFFALSIVTLLKTDGLLSKLLETKLIQFLGKISYSIYLNHLLVISLTPKIMFSVLKLPQNTSTEIVVFLVSILIVIIYSNYTYRFIEVKGGKYLRKLLLK
jgi:peptidoglycan/LPS O-acetylase OafA/YrhL